MIVPLANYSTSRDYRRLWELAHDHMIVCVVDYEPVIHDIYRDIATTSYFRDIATTRYFKEWSPGMMLVISRGVNHVLAESIEEFIAQCERCNLLWLQPLPNPEAKP